MRCFGKSRAAEIYGCSGLADPPTCAFFAP
jgi:hypothetical protein